MKYPKSERDKAYQEYVDSLDNVLNECQKKFKKPLIKYQVGYDAPDGYGFSFTKLEEFKHYEEAEGFLENTEVNFSRNIDYYIKKVYRFI